MIRLHLLHQLIAGSVLALAALGCSGAPSSGGVSARRPNILFITADDMSFDSLGCTGCSLPDISPNLDRLAREGLLIEHCHVATPVCGPSRAAFITGGKSKVTSTNAIRLAATRAVLCL